jgi:N-acetyl-anhydromuramyl-L-alanine amidase AmpD
LVDVYGMAYAFVPAKYFKRGGNLPPTRVVIHDMEAPEKGDTAESTAAYFQRITTPASAHYCIDNNSIVQCVHEGDVAYHAPPNTGSIGLEHAGYANQSMTDWLDDYGKQMLDVSAALTADICKRYSIPIQYIDAAGLLAGKHGITTHAQVSQAWHQSDHSDPGPNFPMAQYLDMIRGHAAPPTATGTPQEVRPVVNAPVVTTISHPTWNGGYIQIGADGGTFSWVAPNFGSAGGTPLNSPVVAAAVSPSGQGYWLVAADGGVFSYGDAGFHGSMGGTRLNKPIIAITPTGTGQGYWLTGSDGGVFSFGDAVYHGAVQFNG